MRLFGKIALVTGAARGIGRGIALRFAEEGAKVGVLDMNYEDCQQVVYEIEATGGKALALEADIRNEGPVINAIHKLKEAFGICTILMNNAAVMPSGRIHETSPEDFDRCIAVNLRGTYLICRALIPDMLEHGGGSIIHMASVTGMRGLPGIAVCNKGRIDFTCACNVY